MRSFYEQTKIFFIIIALSALFFSLFLTSQLGLATLGLCMLLCFPPSFLQYRLCVFLLSSNSFFLHNQIRCGDAFNSWLFTCLPVAKKYYWFCNCSSLKMYLHIFWHSFHQEVSLSLGGLVVAMTNAVLWKVMLCDFWGQVMKGHVFSALFSRTVILRTLN